MEDLWIYILFGSIAIGGIVYATINFFRNYKYRKTDPWRARGVLSGLIGAWLFFFPILILIIYIACNGGYL